jgi:ADP-ribose pyrophosphatase YjhB (NUDIX family)
VAVVVLPVEHAAVLMVRRATPPFGLALPSGFVEYGERWQDAAAREVQEETGVRIDPEEITSFRVTSGNDGMLLVYATAPPVGRDALDAFEPSDEVSELLVVDRPDADVVFPRDGEVLAAWFDGEPSHSASRWRSSASSRSDDRRR